MFHVIHDIPYLTSARKFILMQFCLIIGFSSAGASSTWSTRWNRRLGSGSTCHSSMMNMISSLMTQKHKTLLRATTYLGWAARTSFNLKMKTLTDFYCEFSVTVWWFEIIWINDDPHAVQVYFKLALNSRSSKNVSHKVLQVLFQQKLIYFKYAITSERWKFKLFTDSEVEII